MFSNPKSLDWMNKTVEIVRSKYPELPYTFSFDYKEKDVAEKLKNNPLPHFDLLEQHLWMVSLNGGEFNKTMGYNWHRFSNESYLSLIENGEKLY